MKKTMERPGRLETLVNDPGMAEFWVAVAASSATSPRDKGRSLDGSFPAPTRHRT